MPAALLSSNFKRSPVLEARFIVQAYLEYLYVAAAVVLLFGAAVFVHEWGHYIVARKRGLKVEAFAIGFGPKIFSWMRDGVEWSWRWIPAGGFVKLPQMITSEALEGDNKGEPLPPASPLSKILVAFAGPLMNVVFAFVLATIIYFVGLPLLVNPSVVGYVNPDSPEGKLGIREGDKIVSVDGKATRTWQDVQEKTVLAHTNVLAVVLERNGERKTYQLEAKPSEVGGKFLNLEPKDHPAVLKTDEGSSADKAGVKEKDVIVSFAGVPVSGREQLIALVQKKPDQPAELVVERGPNKEKVVLTVTPTMDPNTKRVRIGIMFGNAVNIYEVQKPGPLPHHQIKAVWDQMVGTISALINSEKTGVGAKDLSGPVGIFAMLGERVKTDWRLALSFLVLLNINLAVLNLLPLPVLDGGHIVMSIFEAIFRRPLPVKIQEYATTVFALALISFMLYVSFHDIKRFSLFRSMYQQENRIEGAPSSGSVTNK